MVTQITLGNISQQNGRTVINGGQSGLDIEGLVKSLTDAKRLPATKLEDKNKSLDKQTESLTELQTLLTKLRSALDPLRNPPGVANASKNIFEYRTATSSASGVVSVQVQPGTQLQNVSIDSISFLAKETKQQTATTFSATDQNAAIVLANGDTTPGALSAGTFTLKSATGGADSSITLAQGDSLATVVNKFNAVKGNTGIQANLVQVSSGSPNTYTITFSATKTGTDYAFDLGSATTVTSDTNGVLAQLGFTTTQGAHNAQFTIDGVPIIRQTNVINDLVNGMTFTLQNTTAAPVNVSVTADTTIVTNAINAFADAYNELRVFNAKQNETGDDGLPKDTAVLFGNSTLRSVVDQMNSVANSLVSGLGATSPSTLAEIGISFDDFKGDADNPATRGIITINADKLASTLAANFDQVRGIFEFQYTSDNSNLLVFKRTNALSANNVQIHIDTVGGVYTATVNGNTYNLDASSINSTSLSLNGQAGTPLEGLQLVYGANTSADINLSMTQGIGDKLYNVGDSALATDGIVVTSLKSITDQEARNTTEITKIDDYISTYRDQLLSQYSDLEAALSKANQLLNLLDAQQNARNNS